ncbi:MAG: hypothetical protein KBD63_07530, partial [Bacteriovoracaceae bacterium]|nr:hypothetical protein [Bacteriovoracaceae bacterium]
TGKTGSEVQKLLSPDNLVGPFNKRNPPTKENLEKADVVIVFVAGSEISSLIPLLLETNLPVIWGSTGVVWPTDLQDKLKAKNLCWIHSHNFSLAMMIIKKMLSSFSEIKNLLPDGKFSLSETHHVHKKDAPSGTALSMQEWLGFEIPLTSVREGDVIGIHELIFETAFEKINLKHTAKSRALFAQGALWSAQQLLQKKQKNEITSGLYPWSIFFT